MIRQINNYIIKVYGGFIMVKHWIVYDSSNNNKGTFFKYANAKEACLSNNFEKAFKGKLY